MPPPLSGINERVDHVETFNVGKILLAAALRMLRGKVDRACVSFTDCGRVMRDIGLGMLCGATMGLFVAMVGDVF